MPARKGKVRPGPRLGKQPPKYYFFLNPYTDARFTSCPKCGAKTRVRKIPLVIHVEPGQLVSLNKICRLCIACDLLIVHQDELEAFLAAYFGEHRPEMLGNDYLVLGTQSRADWLKGMQTPLPPQQAFEYLHDFRDYWTFQPSPRWGPA